MELSLKDAATLLGKSPRQLRYLLATGRLKGEKHGKSWRFDPDKLPLTEAQRQSLRDRADTLQEAAQAAASKAATAAGDGKRHYSVTDMRAYQLGEPLYQRVAAAWGVEDPAAGRLRRALECIALGCHAYHGGEKRAHYAAAREAVAIAIIDLRLHLPTDQERCAVAEAVEQTLRGPLNALIRRAERRMRGTTRAASTKTEQRGVERTGGQAGA